MKYSPPGRIISNLPKQPLGREQRQRQTPGRYGSRRQW
jgi:hypothetical protein